MKKLGFGFMRLPLLDGKDSKSIDYEAVNKMVDLFMKSGFTYFDTAHPYHEGYSEIAIGKCLADRYPRESFFLTDKLTLRFVPSKDKMGEFFENQLKKCRVSYFDNYLIHNLGVRNYEIAKEYGAFDFVRSLKQQGKIKNFGFSFHDTAEVLETILSEQPDVDFVQLQINYLDWESREIQSRLCCEVAQKYNKKILIMEPVKGGTLANLPKKATELLKELDQNSSAASWAIRFAASLDNSYCVLSGMSNYNQVLDNTSYMQDFKALTQEETEAVFKVADIIRMSCPIPCTSCRYCLEVCPKAISIPESFTAFNASLSEEAAAYEKALAAYGKISSQTNASCCIGCGKCEAACPQHLEIRKLLKQVQNKFN